MIASMCDVAVLSPEERPKENEDLPREVRVPLFFKLVEQIPNIL